jgi:hypothetical protein
MARHRPTKSQQLAKQARQRKLRRTRNEHVFLFTPTRQLVGEVERDAWEHAIRDARGNTAEAAKACGFVDVSQDTRALWGRSADDAWSRFRQWQKRQRA